MKLTVKDKVSVCILQPQHLVQTAVVADGCFQTQQYATLSTTVTPYLAKQLEFGSLENGKNGICSFAILKPAIT